MNKLMEIFESFPSKNRMETIAKWYDKQDSMPIHCSVGNKLECRRAWYCLADECTYLSNVVRKLICILPVSDAQPYQSSTDMFLDIRNLSHFYVSSANCNHPLWTPDQNIDFRIVHDCLGHYPSGGQFDWEGEIKACNAHADHLSELAQRAVFTECIAQVAYRLVNGSFGPQKIALV